jgi:hypothetical protein
VIQTIRWVVNQEPLLYATKTKDTEAVTFHAKVVRGQRRALRVLFQELSRYYERTAGVWTRAELLYKCEHGRIRCTGNVPLTHFPVSVEGFREFLWSPANSRNVGAWSTGIDNGSPNVPMRYLGV